MAAITVITYTYNRKGLLRRTIECVLGQTFSDFVYYIVDNGSTDRSCDIIEEYRQKDGRVKSVMLEKNETGIQLTRLLERIMAEEDAEYYTVVDDDDYMEPDTLETLYRMAQETGSDITGIGSRFVYPDGSMEDKFAYEGTFTFSRVEAMEELLKREKINSARGGKLYRKSLLWNVEYPDVPRLRDIHREYRVMNGIQSMTVTGKPMFYFYRHGKNYSGLNSAEQITPFMMEEHLHANRIRTVWLTEHMPEVADYVSYSEISFMLSLYNRIYHLKVKPCYAIAQRMRAAILANWTDISGYPFYTEREREIMEDMRTSGNKVEGTGHE